MYFVSVVTGLHISNNIPNEASDRNLKLKCIGVKALKLNAFPLTMPLRHQVDILEQSSEIYKCTQFNSYFSEM